MMTRSGGVALVLSRSEKNIIETHLFSLSMARLCLRRGMFEGTDAGAILSIFEA